MAKRCGSCFHGQSKAKTSCTGTQSLPLCLRGRCAFWQRQTELIKNTRRKKHQGMFFSAAALHVHGRKSQSNHRNAKHCSRHGFPQACLCVCVCVWERKSETGGKKLGTVVVNTLYVQHQRWQKGCAGQISLQMITLRHLSQDSQCFKWRAWFKQTHKETRKHQLQLAYLLTIFYSSGKFTITYFSFQNSRVNTNLDLRNKITMTG